MGGLWYGTLHIGNDTFLRSGQNIFGTRSDDGSALWIDLDRDGDFSRTNANNLDEMVVNNLGNHGSRNRVGTVFLGYKSQANEGWWTHQPWDFCGYGRC